MVNQNGNEQMSKLTADNEGGKGNKGLFDYNVVWMQRE